MSEVRRFDELERVVRDTRQYAEDSVSTVLSRLGTHTHSTEARYAYATSTVSAPSTALVSTGLGLNVSAGGQYVYEAKLFYSASAGGDLKIATAGPSGFAGRMSLRGIGSAQTTGVATIDYSAGLASDQPTVGGRGDLSVLIADLTIFVEAVSATGAISLFIGQGTADATPTKLFSGSFARVMRVN